MEEKNIFTYLGPGKSFVFGIIISLLVIFSIGFFVLLFREGGVVVEREVGDRKVEQVAEKEKKEIDKEADSNIKLRAVSKDEHIRGDFDKAEVFLVEYSDMECPFCKRFHQTLKQVKDEYGDKLAWVYRHFPLDNLHSKARKEAQASECAAELGGNDAFWKYLDRIYEITPSNNRLDLNKLPEIAAEIGLDVDKFKECLDSDRHKDKVQADYEDAVASGGRGTPHSILVTKDGKKVPVKGAVPPSQLKYLIDSLLSSKE